MRDRWSHGMGAGERESRRRDGYGMGRGRTNLALAADRDNSGNSERACILHCRADAVDLQSSDCGATPSRSLHCIHRRVVFRWRWERKAELAAKRTALRPWLRIVMVVLAGAAAYVGVRELFADATRWSRYGGFDLASILILVRIVSFVPWCVFVAALAARMVIRRRTC
jgi:hypothetical protein